MQRAVQQLESELLQRFPAATPTVHNVPLQTEWTVDKSFNMTPDYCWHKQASVKEHVQNWYDQCKTVAVHQKYQTKSLAWPPMQHAAGTIKFLAILDESKNPELPSYALGYVAVIRETSSTRSVVFKNFATALTIDMMSLGCSSKRDVDELAGGHVCKAS